MTHLAFATCEAWPDLTPSDRRAAEALQARGVRVTPAIWNDRSVEWGEFDRVIIRSPWDYFRHQADFAAWLDRLDEAEAVVENPTAVLRWNLDKVYLRELERRGVTLVPTHWVDQGATAELGRVLRERRWEHAVVKPTVSAGAANTWVTSPLQAGADQARLAPLLAQSGLMIQRFMPEIRTEGEWSLVFFRKRFSHAVVKRPAVGDFRVQVDHGGTTEPATPSPELLTQARKVLDAVDHDLLYARVDGLDVGGELWLMELEVLEPDLFLGHATGAAERFADAVLAAVRHDSK